MSQQAAARQYQYTRCSCSVPQTQYYRAIVMSPGMLQRDISRRFIINIIIIIIMQVTGSIKQH